MGGWRGSHAPRDHSQQESQWIAPRSKPRKPPSGLSWQPTVPAWEKEFCSSVCRIPWRKICETRRVMSFYKNVVEWNDSAGEEALHNAKTRFWAEINGLPCDISLPDPDIYIDAVDWNSYIDPELLLDLDREPPVPDVGENKDGKLGFLDSTLSNQPIICTGWDDTDFPVMEANNAVGPGCENYLRIADNSNVWGRNDEENKVAEGNSWESGWGDYNKNCNNINNAWESSARENRIAVNNSWNSGWGQWDNYDRSADNSNARGQYAPRSSRFHGDYCQTNGGWRNDKGRKRASFVHERPIINKRPLASWQWNSIQSCGPMYQDKSTQSGNQCNWEKPVS
ncbi:hypothetical protein AAC387_Pa11g1008 [Persea americana]